MEAINNFIKNQEINRFECKQEILNVNKNMKKVISAPQGAK